MNEDDDNKTTKKQKQKSAEFTTKTFFLPFSFEKINKILCCFCVSFCFVLGEWMNDDNHYIHMQPNHHHEELNFHKKWEFFICFVAYYADTVRQTHRQTKINNNE